jgi:hypothetical protein
MKGRIVREAWLRVRFGVKVEKELACIERSDRSSNGCPEICR